MGNRVATVLVAGNSLFREGLLLILSTTAFRVCKVAATMDDLSVQSLPTSRPVLFLIGSEGAHGGTTALAVGRVREQNSSARIVVLGDRCELNDALAVFRAGADGYLFEQISRDTLIKSLDLVMLGATVLPAAIMRVVGEEHEMVSRDNPAVPAAQTDVPAFDHTPRELSHREMGILRCLMQGEPNKTIARRFDITEATVKAHIKAILRKICVRNRTQAAVWAHNHSSGLTNTVLGSSPVLLG